MGPSKVRDEQIQALVAAQGTILGTSHRKPAVKNLVGGVRAKLTDLFQLPDGWEIVLGNGGSTAFWDVATFGLSASGASTSCSASSPRSSPKRAPPHPISATRRSSRPSPAPTVQPSAEDGIDLYALTHNETSTGVSMQLERPAGTIGRPALVVVDATSAAGGIEWDPSQVDTYYFAPQKCFASDGGLWIAACSPAAVERIKEIGASDRWRPASLDLAIALDNSTQNQTYNTPALATLVMLDAQLDWMLGNGGLRWAAGRSATSAATLYGWAEAREWATPFVTDPADRSNVVGTIDLDDRIDANKVCDILRANGILDTDSYRKLGRNQLRIGMFPAIDPSDVEALTTCIDHVVEQLG